MANYNCWWCSNTIRSITWSRFCSIDCKEAWLAHEASKEKIDPVEHLNRPTEGEERMQTQPTEKDFRSMTHSDKYMAYRWIAYCLNTPNDMLTEAERWKVQRYLYKRADDYARTHPNALKRKRKKNTGYVSGDVPS